MRSLSTLRLLASASVAAIVSLWAAHPAFAQDGVAPAPSLPPPVAAAPPAAEALTVPGGYTCVLTNTGADPGDALTANDVICHSLATHHAKPGAYDVRIGRLGGKLLLVIAERDSGNERRLFLQGIEEVPVAGDRMAKALAENKTVDQAAGPDNIVGPETATPKQKAVEPGLYLGLTGLSAAGAPATPSGGVEIDLDFRIKRFMLVGQGRAGGIGSAGNKLGYASLGIGGRYFLSEDDIAPYVGAGLEFAYLQANRDDGSSYSGSGFGAAAEVGLGLFRSSHVGGLVNLRADLPLFKVDPNFFDGLADESKYVVPISLNLGLTFQ